MSLRDRDDFSNHVKTERDKIFKAPFEFVYEIFCELNFDKKQNEYFRENASEYVEIMRKKCWEKFVPIEKKFTTEMLSYLIDRDKIEKLSPVEAIETFVADYPEHIYDLSLSNTQSRRSRAGKEFEAIIMLLLVGANISADEQGAIGKQFFQEHNIGKLVDFISPGVAYYLMNKRDTFLISAKTTLRERWQEVPEEVSRTGAREMYLTTLDDSISADTLKILYESNIFVVTTKINKEKNYSGQNSVITFETMIADAMDICSKWNTKKYTEEEYDMLERQLSALIKKYSSFSYVKDYYLKKLGEIKRTNFALEYK